MKTQYFLIAFIFSSLFVFSQVEHKFVKLEEVKKGKRLDLYAQNTDTIAYDVFLKVDTDNYRKSSNRPIIRTIEANSRVKLITLIQLTGKPDVYSKIFIVNEIAYSIDIQKDFEDFNIRIDEQLKAKKVTIFTRDACDICPKSLDILKNNNIKFIEYNVDKDPSNYDILVSELKQMNPQSDYSRMPLMKINDNVYNDIETIDDFVNTLKKEFN